MASPDSDRTAARLKIVEEHVQHENNHDLDGILSTFGEDPVYEERAWNERHEGLSGVRDYYVALIEAMPDLFIDVRRSHVTDETIVLEVVISGTHQGLGEASRRRDGASSFRSARSTPSPRRTSWRASGSTMIAPPCYASSASTVSRTRCSAESRPL